MEDLLIEHKLNAWRYFFETGHCTSPANADSEWDVDVVISDAIDTGDNYLHQLQCWCGIWWTTTPTPIPLQLTPCQHVKPKHLPTFGWDGLPVYHMGTAWVWQADLCRKYKPTTPES
jgi:hypothetical protein